MENNNIEKKTSFRNWYIKRLLANESTREEILNYIASNPLNENSSKLEDNNEEHLIKNILNLDEKSVEDVMVPRAEIISLEKGVELSTRSYKSYYSLIGMFLLIMVPVSLLTRRLIRKRRLEDE